MFPAGMPGCGGGGTITVPPSVVTPLAPKIYSAPLMGWRRSVDAFLYTRSRQFNPPVVSTGQSYSTTFPLTENPISESNNWQSRGTTRTRVSTASGYAIGTQTGSGGFDDSYACLVGTWSADQRIVATVRRLSPSGIQEIELLFRVTDSSGSANVFCYEINIAQNGAYVDFVRWDGPATGSGDFTYLIPTGTYSIAGGVTDGDIFMGEMVGDTLRLWVDHGAGAGYEFVGSASDTSVSGHAKDSSGSPGIGFYREAASGAATQYGWADIAATSLSLTTYATTFSGGTENPLSEGSKWTTGSTTQPAMQVASGGVAYGTQTGDEHFTPIYNDSQAFLSGFSKNHRAEVTISLLGTPNGDLEVECLLGAKFGSLRTVGTSFGQTYNNTTDFDGIEINLTNAGNFSPGIQGYVSRYLDGTIPGSNAVDDFSTAFRAHGIHDGDKLCAQLWLNDGAQTGVVTVTMIRATTGKETLIGQTPSRASYYRIGNPGLGTYRENASLGATENQNIYCATAFYARDA